MAGTGEPGFDGDGQRATEAELSRPTGIAIDADARASKWIAVDLDAGRVQQTLRDPAGFDEWILEAEIDLEASRTEDQAVVRPVNVTRR